MDRLKSWVTACLHKSGSFRAAQSEIIGSCALCRPSNLLGVSLQTCMLLCET